LETTRETDPEGTGKYCGHVWFGSWDCRECCG